MNSTETIKIIIDEILGHFKVKPKIETSQEEEAIKFDLVGDDLSFLIGYKGQTLDAFHDMITHIYYKKTGEWPVILLDINGYNVQRIERLQNIAKRFIDRVRFFQNEVELPFMNPWERRQVHTLIAEYDDVESESRGEGKNRKLYLKPKNQADNTVQAGQAGQAK